MANPQHAEILSRGVREWNKWREENPTVWPDLLQAPLARALLDNANFENTNLFGANLEVASLVKADLRNSNLKDARLLRANLTDASLLEANLHKADLREANLHGADLQYTNLTSANFDSSVLDYAVLGYASIDKGILKARGLDRIIHRSHSYLDVETLEETTWLLERQPALRTAIEWFYRGVGVPEHLIQYALSRVRKGSDWYTCFLSYSRQDHHFASALWARLQDRGIRCWKDDHDSKIGADLIDEISSAIISHDRVLLCCSRHSLTSQWVEREIYIAREKEKRVKRNILLPLDVDGYVMGGWRSRLAPYLCDRMIGNFVGWEADHAKFESGLELVVNALQPGAP
jgi:uncharacterized protein YjbI with pentapeptide repeats